MTERTTGVKSALKKTVLSCTAAALALSMTACGGSDSSQGQQEAGGASGAQEQDRGGDMQERSLGNISLEIPESWVPSPKEELGGDWTEGFDDAEENPKIRVRMAPEINDSPHPDVVEGELAARAVAGGYYGPDWEGSRREKTEIPGAFRGYVADFTYVAGDKQMRGRWLLMTNPETYKVETIEIAGQEDALTDDLLDDISDSVEMKPGK